MRENCVVNIKSNIQASRIETEIVNNREIRREGNNPESKSKPILN